MILFLVAGESRDDAIICSASATSPMLTDYSGVEVDAILSLLWCL